MTMSEPDIFSTEGDLQEEDLILRRLYVEMDVPLDMLAYTKDFEDLYRAFLDRTRTPENRLSRAELYRRLLSLRKSGRLPRLSSPRRPTGTAG